MPLGHLGLNVRDLTRAKLYYDEFMPLVDYVPFFAKPGEFSYRPANEKPGMYIFFYSARENAEYSRHKPGLQHLAFIVGKRATVRGIYQWAQGKGADILHEPQEFPQYHPGYFATFWLSPEGFMLEAVCHREKVD